jgi:hypothetical protein
MVEAKAVVNIFSIIIQPHFWDSIPHLLNRHTREIENIPDFFQRSNRDVFSPTEFFG